MSPLSLFGLLALSLQLPAGDWIVTRSSRVPFETSVVSAVVLKSFGPFGRFALVRASSPWRVSGDIVAVQPNFPYSFAGDPDLEKSWGLDNHGQVQPGGLVGIEGKDIGATEAWRVFGSGNPEIIAILDSGIDLSHEDLRDVIWTNENEIAGNHIDEDGNGLFDDVNGWNFVTGSADVSDSNGHGTFCAGIVGAREDNGKGSRGIHPSARLMAVKMLDGNGFGTTASAIAAIHYAVEKGARVLNASWGGGNYDQALYDTVKWAGEKGALFVAAAGNDGKHNDTDPRPTYPASFKLPNVISVAAYDARDGLAAFSNFGKETVHVGAPGVDIYSTKLGGYRYGEGTSFAAPFVSGVAALLKSHVPALTLPLWRERLLMSSVPMHYYERERTASGGRIHAANALNDFRPVRPAPPSVWTGYPSHEGTPHPYDNKASQEIHVSHPGARHVRVHFKGFDTEACCDRVKLSDREGRVVTEYRGELGDFWSADAIGDEVVVRFTSDFSMTRYGFEIDRYEVSY